jgi:hypothetical protein
MAERDHRHGHRDRLRRRLLRAGREAFEDYELLELLLAYAIPRIDVKPLAKRLIERFGSFAAVFDQPRERLLEIEGVGPQAATLLLALRSAMVRYYEEGVEKARRIAGPEEVRTGPRAPEVLITDVEFGVSQILPVIAICYYVPEGGPRSTCTRRCRRGWRTSSSMP